MNCKSIILTAASFQVAVIVHIPACLFLSLLHQIFYLLSRTHSKQLVSSTWVTDELILMVISKIICVIVVQSSYFTFVFPLLTNNVLIRWSLSFWIFIPPIFSTSGTLPIFIARTTWDAPLVWIPSAWAVGAVLRRIFWILLAIFLCTLATFPRASMKR